MSDPAAGGGGAWANGGPRFGDMVWAKVKSHPWWPGHIYSVSLTDDEEVHRGYRDGLVLVAFFGDSSYGWFEPSELVPFEDHFTEKAAQGGSSRSSFAAAVAEAVDEVARRSALALLCPCNNPDAFRPHPIDGNFFLVDVPAFDTDADYHRDQIRAARQRFVPRKALDYLLDAAVTQQDAAEKAARTVPGMEMAGLFTAYRRAVFSPIDNTYAQAFGVDPELALAAEQKAAAERAQRARPLKGGLRKTAAEQATPTGGGRRRGGAGGAAARLMEKIVPGASAMKAKSSSKKDQYLLKRRVAPEASSAHHRQPQLPDAPPPAPVPVPDDGPPGFPASGDPPTPPLPGSSIADEDFIMLQRRAPLVEVPPPAAHQAQPTEGPTAAAPKKATKPKKPRKREREEGADADVDASPDAVDAAGEPKKRKKKKKLPDLDGAGKAAAVVQDPNGLDVTQVLSDIRNLPLAPFHGADRRISDTARSFVLAFRSKYYKKSYENDPPEESKKMNLDKPTAAAAADGQSPKKKKPAAPRPGAGNNDPTKAGVKRGPSDRQGELAVKKKAKLEKIKTLSSEKKAAGLEQKDTAAAQQQAARAAGGKDGKAEMGSGAAAKKKEPAPAPRVRTPSPTALMMKFPLKSTLPSVASLKARFARFGPLDVDGIRVYWKSHMCRVIYRFKADAEAALRYAKANAMFGQVDTQYHLREVESGAGRDPPLAAPAPEAPPPQQQQRSELRLMETASFRPGSSGNGAPLPMSRAAGAVMARPAVGQQQQPKSILKKSTDEGNSGTTREVSRVKFMLDGADGGKLEPPAPPASVGGNGADSGVKAAKSVGFASSQPLQPPQRALLQQQQAPRAAVTQQLPPPPPLSLQQHLPYHQPRVADGPPLVSPQGQLLAYPPPRVHGEGPSALPGQPLPYQPRPTGFPGGQQQQQVGYPPRSGDSPPLLAGQQQQQQFPPRPSNANAAEEVPAWKRGEKEFKEEAWRLMTGIAKMVEPLTDKNGFFPYHLFRAQ
ncbi:PWWP domain-containing protein 1-like isoform X1 [Miscanthus floridulus]|uniref:PWWP domain-containing protein 1-like isoform X1 n=1 Tax=Miscanthus floridulus TaxID=154761 RepID=UPI00345A5852